MARSILFVDDDPVLLRSCRRRLDHLANVFTATTSREAFETASERQLDAVVVDYQLADENGIDIIAAFKKVRSRPKLLVWSGYASIESAVVAIRAGADDVKRKPVAPRSVLHWLETGRWDLDDANTTASLESMTWEYVHRVVSDCNGNRSEAARRLGIERSTLRAYLRRPAPCR